MENNKVGGGCLSNFYQRGKPYIAMISLQFGYAGMNVITKVSLNGGMSHYVLVVYRHAFATLAIAPFALLLERKLRPKMTFMMFLQIFILGLLGMEKVHIKKLRCQAKVIGTIVTVAGAMLMTLYKGHVINLVWANTNNTSNVSQSNETSDKDWLKGSILLIGATFAWASFFILQAITMRKYTAPLSLTTLVCFMGTLQSIAVTLVMEHKPSAWAIGFDMNLLAAVYAGIVSSSLAYYVQGLVMEKRGPVFVTAFSPLMMIIVAIMGSFILAEKIYLGGVLGAVLIVAGLYSVLWGKYKEYQEKEIEGPLKGVVTNDIEMQTSEVVIGVSMQQPTNLAKEVPIA
ncbi:WAT1-related protein At5g07050-like isoform X2 [Solanum stenotomum]|uniref:WAT1-related protein At5g07050-like isoform X2 n=1 Tax=Solanum stenotomum TaxID=172797 RepID=UPI0020D16E2D|nr:WAT1-related protein At5g07050-like isoform X2 [Solanum stenotomum]